MAKKRKKLKKEQQLLATWAIVLLVVASISLTIIESLGTLTDTERRVVFSVQMLILFIFFIEFIYRLWAAKFVYPKLSPAKARMKHLINPLTIVDFIVIIPLFLPFQHADFVIFRILRITTLFNVFKLYRSSKILKMIKLIFHEVKNEFAIVLIFAAQIILIAAVLIYHLEAAPVNYGINSILDGLWWSIVTVTTVGYGDIVPVTAGGRVVGSILGILGVGLVALPTGILTAAFFRILRDIHRKEAQKEQKKMSKTMKKLTAEDEGRIMLID